MDNSTVNKCCSKCKQEKPATPEFFTRNKSCSDGLHTQCKVCRTKKNRQYWDENRDELNERRRIAYWENPEIRQRNIDYHRVWRTENRDKHLEGKRRWYRENRAYDLQKSREWRAMNPEYKKEYDKEYVKKNKKRIRQRKHIWAVKNRDKINEARRKRYAEDPTLRRVRSLAREARRRNLPNTFTEEDYSKMMEYWGGCIITGETENLHIDHWIPLNSPNCPGTVPQNMIPLAQRLNTSKQDKDALEWMTEIYGNTKAEEIMSKIETYFKLVSLN